MSMDTDGEKEIRGHEISRGVIEINIIGGASGRDASSQNAARHIDIDHITGPGRTDGVHTQRDILMV